MRNEMHGMELEVLADNVCERKFIEYSHEDMICTKGRAPRYDSACNVCIPTVLYTASHYTWVQSKYIYSQTH